MNQHGSPPGLRAEHDGRGWQKDAQGTITWWDGNQWVWWDPNVPGPQPPPWFLAGRRSTKKPRRWPLIVVGVFILLVIIGILTSPDDEPANEPSAEPQCDAAHPRFVTIMNEQLRNGTKPLESMVFEEIEVSEVPLLERTAREHAWVIAGDVGGEPAAWVTGNDPTNPGGESGLTAPLNHAARRAATLGIDIRSELLPTDLSEVETLTRCLD